MNTIKNYKTVFLFTAHDTQQKHRCRDYQDLNGISILLVFVAEDMQNVSFIFICYHINFKNNPDPTLESNQVSEHVTV